MLFSRTVINKINNEVPMHYLKKKIDDLALWLFTRQYCSVVQA